MLGLPMEKEHTVYQKYGNMVSAALPSALITHANDGVLKAGEKVLGVVLLSELDPKVVNHEAESDGTLCVAEKTRYIETLDVPVRGKMCDKALLRQQSSLWQTIHPFIDLK